MKFFSQTPAEQIAFIMRRVYDRGLTTATGGNISMLTENGDIWITPKGFDKGSLTAEDIVCVHPDGTYTGKHEPSSEIFFHRASYRARPDFRAVVHAHPVYCIAFSLTRTLPRIDLLPDTLVRCGNLRLSKYAMMGSAELGENMYDAFSRGADVVFLENHGVCVGGENLLSAYQLFETIEYAAKLDLLTRKLGKSRAVTGEQLSRWTERERHSYPAFVGHSADEAEREIRTQMVQKLRRGCEHALLTGETGACSARIDHERFLITPEGLDNALLEESDLVLVKKGACEAGKAPAREKALHEEIYEKRAEVNAIFSAIPAHVAAFACSDQRFETFTIPESFYMLRAVPSVSMETYLSAPEAAALFTEKTPVVLFQNARIVATGNSLFTALDRLEVAEATASSIIIAQEAGRVILLSEAEIQAMKMTFHLE